MTSLDIFCFHVILVLVQSFWETSEMILFFSAVVHHSGILFFILKIKHIFTCH